jgi:hypothetical protein
MYTRIIMTQICGPIRNVELIFRCQPWFFSIFLFWQRRKLILATGFTRRVFGRFVAIDARVLFQDRVSVTEKGLRFSKKKSRVLQPTSWYTS